VEFTCSGGEDLIVELRIFREELVQLLRDGALRVRGCDGTGKDLEDSLEFYYLVDHARTETTARVRMR
jgi:hypothetical protein